MFWDYENVKIPKGTTGPQAVNRMRVCCMVLCCVCNAVVLNCHCMVLIFVILQDVDHVSCSVRMCEGAYNVTVWATTN